MPKVRFIRQPFPYEWAAGVYEEGQVYDLSQSYVDRWLRRGAIEVLPDDPPTAPAAGPLPVRRRGRPRSAPAPVAVPETPEPEPEPEPVPEAESESVIPASLD